MPILINFCIIFAAGNIATQFNYLCFMFIDFDDFDYHVLPDPLEIVDCEINFDDLGFEPIHVGTDFN